jgi:hypothetical protein
MIGWYIIINRKDVDGRIPNHDEGNRLRGEKKIRRKATKTAGYSSSYRESNCKLPIWKFTVRTSVGASIS